MDNPRIQAGEGDARTLEIRALYEAREALTGSQIRELILLIAGGCPGSPPLYNTYQLLEQGYRRRVSAYAHALLKRQQDRVAREGK